MPLARFLAYCRTWSALAKLKAESQGENDPSIELERNLLAVDGIADLDTDVDVEFPFFAIVCHDEKSQS